MLPCESRSGASRKSVKVLLILIKDEKGAGSSQSHPLSLWELGGGGKRRRHALSGCGELECESAMALAAVAKMKTLLGQTAT